MNNLIGLRFAGLLVVEGPVRRDKYGNAFWLCKCDCGNMKVMGTPSLRAGAKSCGCYQLSSEYSKLQALGAFKHGHTLNGPTPTYKTWQSMMARCYYTKMDNFKYWGGRGIKVCERWHKFENFLADMGERPKGRTLDRWPNPDGDYEPGNCRWATAMQQRKNRGSGPKFVNTGVKNRV